MPGKMSNWRVVEGDAFVEGAEKTFRIRRNENVLKSLHILIKGKITFTAAVTRFNRGVMAGLLENVKLDIDGYDKGLGLNTGSSTRVNLPGWMLAHSPVGQVGTPRFSVMSPFVPILNAGNTITEPGTNAAEHEFEIMLSLPFVLPRGRAPGDIMIDMANLNTLDLTLKMANAGDVVETGGGDVSLSETQVSIIAEELRPKDARVAQGNDIFPQMSQKWTYEKLSINADNEEYIFPVRMSGANIGGLFLFAEDDGNNDIASDNIIEKIRMQRNQNSIIDLPANVVRNINIRQMPNLCWGTGAATQTILKNSGIYMLQPQTPSYPDNSLEAESIYTGSQDNSVEMVLAVKKPTGNATIFVARCETRMSNALAVQSRSIDDLSAVQRQNGGADVLAGEQAEQRITETAARGGR